MDQWTSRLRGRRETAATRHGRMIAAAGLATILLAAAGAARTPPKNPVFKKSPQILQGPARIWGIAAADLDADGDLDIVLGALDGGPLVWLNDGRGGFRASGQAVDVEMHDVAIGDLDGDGDPDLFFAPIRKDKPALFWNDGRGSFRSAPLLAGPSESVQLVDADRDGDLDAYLGKGSVLFINDGRGGFSPGRLAVPDYSSLADLNGDGFIDAVAASAGRGFEVFLNDGKGNFVFSHLAPNKDLVLASLHFTDIDGDGDVDAVYVNALDEGSLSSGVLLNDGRGHLTDSGQKLGSPAAYGSAASGDLNGDGRKDIVITDAAGPARIWLNSGQGTFVDSGLRLGDETWLTSALLADLDGDGDLDVLIPNRRGGRLEIWFNQLMEKKSR